MYPDDKLHITDKIYVRGVSCNLTWSDGQPLIRIDSNTWKITLKCPKNTINIVKLLLNDRTWMIGSNYEFEIINSTNFTVFPSFSASVNAIFDTQLINSTYLSYSRKCSIYLPPSYHDNVFKKYSLIFMHDGQNLFDDSKAAFGVSWKIQNTLNSLIG